MYLVTVSANARSRSRSALHRGGQNAFYGVADYLAQGFAMLAAARFLVHHLGLGQYGLWMLAMAVTSAMESLSSGFGDATIKYVSKYRGTENSEDINRVVRATLTLNGGLGLILAGFVFLASPFAVTHIFKIESRDHMMSIRMLQVAGIIMLCRSLENVFSNTLRAFERYGRTVKISIVTRVLNVGCAVLLAYLGKTALAIMWASLAISVLSLVLQAIAVRATCGPITLLPRIERASIGEILSFGVFSWTQALAGVIFYNADRLVVGAILGTSALGIYAICVQASQPIHGISSAALNFLFPHVSARHAAGEAKALKKTFRTATWANIGIVAILSAPLILFSHQILTIWMGRPIADSAQWLLFWLAIANACLGASVAAHYLLLAFGHARFVALVNIIGGVLSLSCIAFLMPFFGLIGAAFGRLLYAVATSLNLIKFRAVESALPQDK